MTRKLILAGLVMFAAAAAAQEDLGPTLTKIKAARTIGIGYRESSIPFSFLDDRQKPVGFAMDICYKIVDAVKAKLNLPGLEVRLTPVTSATRIPLIVNGTVDLECGSTTNNVARRQRVAFGQTYFLSANRVVSKKSSNLAAIEDLRGKTLVSTSGSVPIMQVSEVNKAQNLGINIVAAKDHAQAFLMVETDRAAGFAMDDVLEAGLVANARNPKDYAISTFAFSKPEPYSFMLPKGDPQFKALVDAVTRALYTSDEMPRLWAKWFTSPIPPSGINLNMPMSDAMKRAFASPTDNPDPAAY